jgi:hypothetical protein
MRKMITALVAAGLLFLVACGGDDDDSTTDAGQDETGADAADNGGGGGGGEFCDQAAALFQPTGDADPDEQLAAAEALEPPAEIAEDWQKLVEGSRDAAEATANIDPNDPDAAAEFSEQYQDLIEASTNVYAYLGDECGLEGFEPPAADGSDLSVPTTAGG